MGEKWSKERLGKNVLSAEKCEWWVGECDEFERIEGKRCGFLEGKIEESWEDLEHYFVFGVED